MESGNSSYPPTSFMVCMRIARFRPVQVMPCFNPIVPADTKAADKLSINKKPSQKEPSVDTCGEKPAISPVSLLNCARVSFIHELTGLQSASVKNRNSPVAYLRAWFKASFLRLFQCEGIFFLITLINEYNEAKSRAILYVSSREASSIIKIWIFSLG